MRVHGLTLAIALTAAACGEADGDRRAFCAAAERLGAAAVPAPDLDRQTLERARAAYEDMAEHAPEEIRGDVRLLNETFQRLADGDVSFIADEEQSVRIAEALDAMDDYVDEECE